MHQIKIQMRVRGDRDGNPIYIGEVNLPVMLDLRAASIIVLPPRSDSDEAALVIRCRDDESSQGKTGG